MTQLFNTLKMSGEKKLFVWLIVGITSLITIVINIMPMQQIKQIIEFNENVYDIINSDDLTYKNISTNLGEYIKEEANKKITHKQEIMDYNFYTSSNRLSMNIMYKDINSITSSRALKEFIQEIREWDYDVYGNVRVIEIGRDLYSNRVLVLICSLIINVMMGLFVLKRKNIDFNKD